MGRYIVHAKAQWNLVEKFNVAVGLIVGLKVVTAKEHQLVFARLEIAHGHHRW